MKIKTLSNLSVDKIVENIGIPNKKNVSYYQQ